MAIFNIDNAAGQGFYMPYHDSTIGDMIGSYSGTLQYNDGSTAMYDMGAVDLYVDYAPLGAGQIAFYNAAFGVGPTYIGHIEGINLDLNENIGDNVANVIINNASDTFYGNDYNDLISGGEGHDEMWGYGGNDNLYGDAGADLFIGGAGNDYINGGAHSDGAMFSGNTSQYTFNRQGNGDIIITDKTGVEGSDYLTGVEAFYFANGSFTADQLAPVVVTPPPPGGGVVNPPPPVASLPIDIHGTGGRDTLVGNDLDNGLFGGAGRDTMWGGAGKDAFVFDTSPKQARDSIKDFYVPQDSIKLDNADFTKIGGNGKLKSGAFFANNTGKAHDANDRVIYDKHSGKLYYDADGTGSQAGVCFSDIGKNLKLSAADFFVI